MQSNNPPDPIKFTFNGENAEDLPKSHYTDSEGQDCVVPVWLYTAESVREIPDGAFEGRWWIEKVILHRNVRRIGAQSFDQAENLEDGLEAFLRELVIPQDSMLQDIGDWAFDQCASLTFVSPFPAGLRNIGETAFGNCGLRFVDLSQCIHLANIGHSCFEQCEHLQTVLLPPNLSRIDEYAFCRCVQLSNISLPASLQEILDNAFYECNSLPSKMTLQLPNLANLSRYSFSRCDFLVHTDFSQCLTLTNIPRGAFSHCFGLTKVVLPPFLISISRHSFWDCKALSNMDFPPSLEFIEEDAFEKTHLFQSWPQRVELSSDMTAFVVPDVLADTILPRPSPRYYQKSRATCLLDFLRPIKVVPVCLWPHLWCRYGRKCEGEIRVPAGTINQETPQADLIYIFLKQENVGQLVGAKGQRHHVGGKKRGRAMVGCGC